MHIVCDDGPCTISTRCCAVKHHFPFISMGGKAVRTGEVVGPLGGAKVAWEAVKNNFFPNVWKVSSGDQSYRVAPMTNLTLCDPRLETFFSKDG